jgi:hypothetical protein
MRPTPFLPITATLAWVQLGLQWMEMMAASGQVIAHRTRRKPTALQWWRMGAEKAEAAFASGRAISRHMAQFPTHDPFAMWHAWAQMLSSGMAPFHLRATRNARLRRRR